MRMDQPKITVDWDAVDWDRVDEAALAIMLLGLHDGWRTWRGFDWEVLNRLRQGAHHGSEVEGQVRHLYGRGIGRVTTALREAFRPQDRVACVLKGHRCRTTGGGLAQAERILRDRHLHVLG